MLFLLCLLFVSSVALGGLYLYFRDNGTMLAGAEIIENSESPTPPLPLPPTTAALAPLPLISTSTPIPIVPSATASQMATNLPPATPPPASKIAINPPSSVNQEAIPDRALEDLNRLYDTDYPVHDYYNTFLNMSRPEVLSTLDVGPRTYQRPAFQIGDRQVFRTDEGSIEATLVEVTDHAYFWVDDALILDESAVRAVGEQFETNEFYGQVAHLFGQPWNPGMDSDPHFSILHLAGSGDEYELGYFSDLDEYPTTLPLFQDSNQQEVIYLNMDQLDIGSDLYFGTLVHELQHLSQWNLDKNESVWLNEGLSQLAELYIGLDTAVPDAYMEQPDTRLDRWVYAEDVIDAHYASTYLFSVYLWEQLDEAGIYELVRQPANGLSAVRKVLQGFDPDRTLEQFLADWATANYLDDPSAGNQYSYTRLALPAPTLLTLDRQLLFEEVPELDQLAVHYIDLDHSGTMNLTFAGDTTAKLIDSPPTSGDQMWFALPDNDTHAQLTATFDLRHLQQATLEFNTWYDLEEGFDFAYVTVSTDQGTTWTILPPQHSSSGNYGPAFSGHSAGLSDANDGWIHEKISLNNFTGNEIMVNFQVLTDFEAVGRGLALDDIAVPELGYFSDVESTESDWHSNGFVRTGWLLPQQWAVQLVRHGDIPEVTSLQLDALNRFQGEVELGEDGGVLIVMPLTPFALEKAQYWLQATG